jgi:CheY-like chemotaxis protein
VSDIVMPHMTGLELARVVKSDFPEIKVLFVTGYSDRLDEATAAGATHVLLKPFHPSDLVAWVRRALAA